MADPDPDPPSGALDSGVAVAPTPRAAVFASGMPPATPATDYGVGTTRTSGADTCNPPLAITVMPDPGSN